MDFSKPRLRSKPHAPCKTHPKHRQSPGVCSLCLNEKLSKLAAHRRFPISRGGRTRSSPLISSSATSSAASSCSSPAVKYGKSSRRNFKNGSTAMGDGLGKSRSVAFGWRRRKDEKRNGFEKGIEGRRWWFWSIFLSPKNNGGDKLPKMMQSSTTRERVITSVH